MNCHKHKNHDTYLDPLTKVYTQCFWKANDRFVNARKTKSTCGYKAGTTRLPLLGTNSNEWPGLYFIKL